MTTEKGKMLAGELYDPMDAVLVFERERVRDVLLQLNQTREVEVEKRRGLVREMLGYDSDVFIQPPFFCDYGTNIRFGKGVYFNYNCVILDIALVTIGDRTMCGPAVQIYAASHPMTGEERAKGLELGRPVTIGSDCWIGGGAIICPGVTIGDGTTIGAGSVVTRDVPSRVFAAGNPCRVIREL